MDDTSQVSNDAPVTEGDTAEDPTPVETEAPADTLASSTESVENSSSPVETSISSPSFDPHSSDEMSFLRLVLSPKAWAARRARTAAHLDKVMELARSKGTIDRTAVRLHLEVSQAAATRYLTALVKQGKLIRRHTQGDNVYTVI